MTDTDKDFLWLSACILVLCAACALMARRVADLDTDVSFLMDNSVTRETIGGQSNG